MPSFEMDDVSTPMMKAFSAVTEDNEFEEWQNDNTNRLDTTTNRIFSSTLKALEEWKNQEANKRVQFPGGMERSSSEGKIDYLLVRDGPMYERWVLHLHEGAKRHEPRNWMLACGPEELERFRESAARHFEAWLRGDKDEDHAAALFFNVNGTEYVREKLDSL